MALSSFYGKHTMNQHNLYSLIASRIEVDRPFILSANGICQHSYGELDGKTAQIAHYFSTLGLIKGDRVMVQVEKSAQAIFVYLACLRAGLVYLPLNTAYKKHELQHFIGNAEPKVIICAPGAVDLFNTLTKATILTLDENGEGFVAELQENADFQTVHCSENDVAAILYTSGTTGKPKGAMITHGNLASNGLALSSAWDWRDNDVLLHALPIFHIHGLFIALNVALLNSSPVIFLPGFSVDAVVHSLPRATVFMAVPTYYVRLLASNDFNRELCKNVRLFTSGSAPLLPQTFKDFIERTGHTIVERYGMTETGINTSNPTNGPCKPSTVGKMLPGISARIVNDDGLEVNINETGNLQIKGPNVFIGYWKMPEKTADEFTDDGYFKTGDVASIDNEGYITLVGRSKDLIITGGLNVYPKELESIIDRFPGVKESAVIGLPHPDFGEAVTAVIVKDGTYDIDEDTVTSKLKDKVAGFKVTKRVFFVAELPRNTMGKVQKNILREKFSTTFNNSK